MIIRRKDSDEDLGTFGLREAGAGLEWYVHDNLSNTEPTFPANPKNLEKSFEAVWEYMANELLMPMEHQQKG